MEEHDPQSASECELVERLAGILWRLRRVPFFEAAIIDARHDQVWHEKNFGRPPEPEGQDKAEESDEEPSDWEASVHFGRALIKDGTYSDALGKLARHEATLMNALTKTLQMLLLLQENAANRKVDTVKLEAIALPPAA